MGLEPWYDTFVDSLAATTDHTDGWGWSNGGRTIEEIQKKAQAHIPRDQRDPTTHIPLIRQLMEARQGNLHLDRDKWNIEDYPLGGARHQMQARRNNVHLDRDMRDPDDFLGGARRNMQTRQDNLDRDKDEVDPDEYSGGPRKSKRTRQDNHIGKNYLDWTAGILCDQPAIDEARSKISHLTSQQQIFGISNTDGTVTTAFSPEGAFRELLGVYDGDALAYENARKSIFSAFERAVLRTASVDRFERWSTAKGIRICAGMLNRDGSMPDFPPYFPKDAPGHKCKICGKSYARHRILLRHKRQQHHNW
jgi:hypothetical protein